MPITSRLYIFEDGGAVKRVPKRIQDALVFGEDAIPEYAGTRQRIATAIIENQNGKPVRILDASGTYWTFDAQGKIHQDLHNSVAAALELHDNAARASRAKVVDLRPQLKKKEWEAKNRWDLSKEDLDRIAADLWPSVAALDDIKPVKGKAQKKPPLTYEAKDAIRELDHKLDMIRFSVRQLSETALKGFSFEARRHGEFSLELKPVWQAVAAVADHYRELKARHRTGRGAWYAVVRLYHKEGGELGGMVEIDMRHEFCPNRKGRSKL
jgi:hypothetical protein